MSCVGVAPANVADALDSAPHIVQRGLSLQIAAATPWSRTRYQKQQLGGKEILRTGCPYFSGWKQRQHPREESAEGRTVAYEEKFGRNLPRDSTAYDGKVTEELLSRANVSFRETTDVATRCASPERRECDPEKPYSEFDGSCNNVAHPDWGESYACLRRLLEPAYRDGAGHIRTARSGAPLPSARIVSTTIHTESETPDRRRSHMLMAFGQFFVHDVSLTPTRPLSRLEINQGLDTTTDVLPIAIPPDDPFYGQFNQTQMAFQRSLWCTRCRSGYREQHNSRTSYIDGSQIYGVNEDAVRLLRAMKDGLLRSQSVNGDTLLPVSMEPAMDNCSHHGDSGMCFHAGDVRVNQNVGQVTMHTIWMREHNRIARKLQAVNPDWDDERLFQVTRRIVQGRLQHLVFGGWATTVLGEALTARYRLRPRRRGYTRYDPGVDATLLNEFAAAALRFGHTTVNRRFELLHANWTDAGNERLAGRFFAPFPVVQSLWDNLARGLMRQPMNAFSRHGDRALIAMALSRPGDLFGVDLFATDIQRGRDNGIRPYADYVRLCHGLELATFDDLHLKGLMPEDVARLFAKIYEDVRDVDLFSAAISEYPLADASMGPTMACIVVDSLGRLKWGDRFYYEHGGQAGSFTPGQLRTIRETTTLAKIVCENTEGTDTIQRHAFLLPGKQNSMVYCSDLPDIDVNQWAEQKAEVAR
ncbi:chorion peroxidase-like [Dermacentor andersoni]|uniref:chorion peroxidase-like n=1 Tax=Dermacentor andersoni TaxID=34620 RepID=UPI003B3AA365